ncbi:MAG TPA: murein biosynthesis integral membrane protein MurJ [Opitutaceae bacterium]|nr:murein biosynthesis integral membrane protein MurJ [Opitutaceae bacterium]
MSRKLKNIGVVSLLTVVSRVLGLVRDQVQAWIFGESIMIDAWVTAFTLPNLFRRLLGEGSLTAAFIPNLQEALREEGEAGAFALLNRVASWLLVVTSALVALAMVACSQSRALTWIDPKWYLAADLAVLMFPYLALICLAAVFNATLNVLERFTEPALSPIWLNVAMILSLAGAGLRFANSELGEIRWLCAGVLVGGFFQMAVPAAVLVRGGWRPRFTLELTPRVRQIARLMTPGLLGTAIYQINVTVSRFFAFSLPAAAAMMFFANRLMELPIGVFAIAVSTVVYPSLARHAVEKNISAMAADFHKGLRLILVINVPAAAGLALLSEPIVRLLYAHGKFTPEAAHEMSVLLALFVIGLPFFSVVNLTVRAFYAVKDTTTPVRIALIDFVVNLVLSYTLKLWFGAPGLVIASTTAIVVQTLLLQFALAKKLPALNFAPLASALAKVVVASLAMSAAVGAGYLALERAGLGRRADWIAVIGLIPVGVAVYGAALWALKIEGRDELAAMLAKLRAKLT